MESFRTWSREAVYFPHQLPCRGYRRHQGQCRTTEGYAAQILPWVRRLPKCSRTITNRGDHRRTGIVYNVTPNAVGVIVHKIVGNRYVEKRVNVRVEHVRHSGCRQAFLDRVRQNHAAHLEAKEKGSTSASVSVFVCDNEMVWSCSSCPVETYASTTSRGADSLDGTEHPSDYGTCPLRDHDLNAHAFSIICLYDRLVDMCCPQPPCPDLAQGLLH
jgi:hypothetical protein